VGVDAGEHPAEDCVSSQSETHGAVHAQESSRARDLARCRVRRPDALDLLVPDCMSRHFSRTLRQIELVHSRFRQPGRSGDAIRPSALADHLTIPQRTRSASRCLLFQPEVCSVFVIIRAIIRQKSLQMAFVQRDYVINQLTAAAADPALSHSILPGASNRGAHRCDLQREMALGTSNPYFAS